MSILRKFSLVIFILFLAGCGNGNSSNSNINPNTESNVSDTNVSSKQNDPYLKFKPVLDEAKLQCPTSSFDPNCSRDYGDFEGFSNEYFYYQGDDLVFHMCGEHNRSELRFRDEFYFSDEVNKTLEAVVKPIPDTDEFTFLQVHGIYNGLNKPVLRVALYEGILKLFVFDGNKYIIKELGKYDNNFTDFKIVSGYGKLFVFKDSKLEMNVSINYPDRCYYKLGVYLQTPGCATSDFREIKEN